MKLKTLYAMSHDIASCRHTHARRVSSFACLPYQNLRFGRADKGLTADWYRTP